MRLGDTIVAISTGAGVGPRCVLRVSGAGASGVMAALAAAGEDARLVAGVRPLRVVPIPSDPGATMPVLAWCFCGPRSYTGEDCVEFVFPGGAAIRRAMLERVLGVEGVRMAEPGEFTARAYLNGKMTPEQAEGVAAVIAAGNAEQLRAARELLEGRTGAAYRALADELASALALVEAGIDFTDQEDVVAISAGELSRRLTGVRDELERLLGGAGESAAESGEPVVVLVGAPNAGKSTLFNALLGKPRAVVSPEAGTTRDAVEERVVMEGVGVRLVDLAGLDAALAGRSAVDELGQRRARERVASSDVVVLCAPWGWGWPEFVGREGQRVVRVRTKSDLVHGKSDSADGEHDAPIGIGASWHGGGVLHPRNAPEAVCALDGWGLGALRRAIADAASGAVSGGAGRGTLVPRHRACLSRALVGVRGGLERALGQGSAGGLADAELIAGELRGALDDLGEVAGQISPDDVIGRVFAAFCVGK